jgi:hypothetical protein
MKTTATTEQYFIKEIQKRFPDSDIETVEEALNRVKDTEYEHIFESEIEVLNNVIIAKFMGYPFHNIEHREVSEHFEINENDLWNIKELKFHSSWDWLMQVIIKIEKENETDCALVMSPGYSYWTYSGEEPLQEFGGYDDIVNIHQAVVEFIKWHNDQI